MKLKYPFPLSALKITLQHHPEMGGEGGYTIIVKGNGEVIYKEEFWGRVINSRKGTVNPVDVFELFCFAVGNGFFEMKNSYVDGSRPHLSSDGQITEWGAMITDLPSSTVIIKTGKQSKSVWNYYGAPKRLVQLENKIKKLAQAGTNP